MNSSTNPNIHSSRQWIYERVDSITKEPLCQERGKMLCPCTSYRNFKYRSTEDVCKHLFRRGFVEDYYIWRFYGEEVRTITTGQHVSAEQRYDIDEDVRNPYVEMVTDAFPGAPLAEQNLSQDQEEPNVETKRFFDMLDMANHPIYEGCKEGQSR
uniref:Transposase-associated domain-containing protein n=1 Tax=Tarenaya spinosa TaxID=228870 RepID=Q1KUP3_9ROSI|nr:hypothetical protein [Tarenaya spinosa]